MTKKPASKSIIANFGALSSAAPAENSPRPKETEPVQRPAGRVGAGIIGATQRSLAEIREERDRLLALVESGGAVQEINPSLIDPSPFPDRLPDDDTEVFEEFKERFAAEGQKVPIQLRVNPNDQDRYQIIFGHRRWRASLELERMVKAIVTDMSDHDLAVAQGIENSDRQDLTWIERALFAGQMDGQQVKPRDIKAALSIDDAELARMRQVIRSVPLAIIEMIGRAPKVGRPRWIAFSGRFAEHATAASVVRKTLSADKVLTSDERFQAALDALNSKKAPEDGQGVLALTDNGGKILGEVTFKGRDIRMKLSKDQEAGFAEFLRSELPELVKRYAAQKASE